jgi:tRNA 2-thiocytidine biosynthesis protein TtcA
MLNEWHKQFPGRIESIFSAISNVAPSQLADSDLFDFKQLKIDRSLGIIDSVTVD